MRRVNPLELRPVVAVLGSGDVGSAVAHALHRAGCAVVLIDDADPAWPRRGMAFVDAWYVGNAELAGVTACFCSSVRDTVAAVAGTTIVAPLSGVLRGLSARGARIVAGQKIVEVDPLSDRALCFGIGERPKRVAAGVLEALAMRGVIARSASA